MLNQIENDLEAHRSRLKGFFAGLGREMEDAVKDYENGLRAFFAGLSPVAKYAKRAQQKLDRIAATKFSVFEYFHKRETDLSRIFADLRRQLRIASSLRSRALPTGRCGLQPSPRRIFQTWPSW